jgi:hypothetical protein
MNATSVLENIPESPVRRFIQALLKQSPVSQGTAQSQHITPHQPVEGLSLRPEKDVNQNKSKQD